jgi:hypothetical protein
MENTIPKRQSFLRKILNSKPLCESAQYLTIWSFLTAVIYLILDVLIEKKVEKAAYNIYRNDPNFYEKYDFKLFLTHIYSILGYNKSFKYIKFFLEILFLPFAIYFYNYACNKNMEYLNYILLILYLLIFISKMNVLLNTENEVNNQVSKSYM